MAEHFVSALATGGGDGSEGDPFTLDEAASASSSGDEVWVKNDGEYLVTSPLSFSAVLVEGYGTYRGDGNQARIKLASDVDAISTSSTGIKIRNVRFDGGNISGARACVFANFSGIHSHEFFNVHVENFVTIPITARTTLFARFTAINCPNGVFGNHDGGTVSVVNSFFHNVGRVFAVAPNHNFVATGCLFSHCLEQVVYASGNGSGVKSFNGCIFHQSPNASPSEVLHYRSGSGNLVIGDFAYCIVSGFNEVSYTTRPSRIYRCSKWNTNDWGTAHVSEDIPLTANPFLDPDNGNFGLNNIAGGGATLRHMNFQMRGGG